MNPSEKQFDEMGSERSRATPGTELTLAKPFEAPGNPVYLSVAHRARITPVSPVMLTPVAAWHHFCARTGGSISLMSFYRWIRNGKVCAVRVGKKFYVPLRILDELIKRCLEGEEF
jgi:hypothetical protein